MKHLYINIPSLYAEIYVTREMRDEVTVEHHLEALPACTGGTSDHSGGSYGGPVFFGEDGENLQFGWLSSLQCPSSVFGYMIKNLPISTDSV